jgi:hypothetical protein
MMYRCIALCIAALIVLIPATPPLAPFASPVIPTMQAAPRRAPTTAIGDAWTAVAQTPVVAQHAPTMTPAPQTVQPPTSAPVVTRTRRVDAAMWRRWERMQEP